MRSAGMSVKDARTSQNNRAPGLTEKAWLLFRSNAFDGCANITGVMRRLACADNTDNLKVVQS